jgi:hypothetical protein
MGEPKNERVWLDARRLPARRHHDGRLRREHFATVVTGQNKNGMLPAGTRKGHRIVSLHLGTAFRE